MSQRTVMIILGAILAGRILTAALVRFAENSDFSTKTLKAQLKLQKQDTRDQLNVTNIPTNVRMTKEHRSPFVAGHPLPPFAQAFPPTAPVVPAAIPKSKDEKAVEDKEKERRKNRKKKLEEKVNQSIVSNPPASVFPNPNYAMMAPSYPDQTYLGFPVPAKTPSSATTTITTTTPTAPVATTTGVVSPLSSKSSVSYWINLLTKSPTPALMESFESTYKANKLSQSDFYSVLTAMQTSSVAEARYLSVQAANLYKNIFSFKILADESQQDSVAQIKSTAGSDVQSYATAAEVPLLNQAAASGDAAEKLVAQNLLSLLGQNPASAVAAQAFVRSRYQGND